ncbi:MAG: type II toxin-antitoxin system RelE/ParE family toxin [Psychrosphaera sp.]|nr:type II toxin-antitoxin system RelE/ParE family toxin [Psychrosphaera sp.]
MAHYELTKDAQRDLQQIARYTLNKWGKAQLQKYRSGLKRTLKLIAQNEVVPRLFSKRFPQLLVTKYQNHFIFYLTEKNTKPVIIGVIHEERDIVNRLARRLS